MPESSLAGARASDVACGERCEGSHVVVEAPFDRGCKRRPILVDLWQRCPPVDPAAGSRNVQGGGTLPGLPVWSTAEESSPSLVCPAVEGEEPRRTAPSPPPMAAGIPHSERAEKRVRALDARQASLPTSTLGSEGEERERQPLSAHAAGEGKGRGYADDIHPCARLSPVVQARGHASQRLADWTNSPVAPLGSGSVTSSWRFLRRGAKCGSATTSSIPSGLPPDPLQYLGILDPVPVLV
jgi:hypothetical protein